MSRFLLSVHIRIPTELLIVKNVQSGIKVPFHNVTKKYRHDMKKECDLALFGLSGLSQSWPWQGQKENVINLMLKIRIFSLGWKLHFLVKSVWIKNKQFWTFFLSSCVKEKEDLKRVFPVVSNEKTVHEVFLLASQILNCGWRKKRLLKFRHLRLQKFRHFFCPGS